MKNYTVIYERGKRNWSAYVPDLPCCIATAKTQKQLERRIREAIEFHIEGLRLHEEPVPEPTIEAGMVFVSVPGAGDVGSKDVIQKRPPPEQAGEKEFCS
jgi:predicted RNase H-like HicB family nuclease